MQGEGCVTLELGLGLRLGLGLQLGLGPGLRLGLARSFGAKPLVSESGRSSSNEISPPGGA